MKAHQEKRIASPPLVVNLKENEAKSRSKEKVKSFKVFFPASCNDAKKLIYSYVFRQLQLEGQMECMDDIDPQVFDEFKALKVRLAQLVCLHF